MSDEIKRLQTELKDFQSKKEQFESINSRLYRVAVKDLKRKINRLINR